MKLAELVYRVQQKTRRMRSPPAAGEIIVALNDAQDEIGRKLGLPKRYAEITYADGELAFSTELREGGIILVNYRQDDLTYALDVIPLAVANRTYPGWEDEAEYTGIPKVVIADVGTGGIVTDYPVRPAPTAGAGTFHAHYICKTLHMTDLEDHEPFALVEARAVGLYPDLDYPLVYRAVATLNPNDQQAYSLYQESMQTMKPPVSSGGTPGKNKMYRRVRRRNRYGSRS